MSDITKIKVDGEPESSYQLYPRNEEFSKRAGGGNGGSGVQPDWNQNDATKPDYVKNRPFYTGDPVETVLLEETTPKFASIGTENIYGSELVVDFSVERGQTYKVFWDGTVYECVCTNVSESLFFGNMHILNMIGIGHEFPDTGEPFLMGIQTGANVLGVYTQDTSASHTISISELAAPITKIDEKYLTKYTEVLPESFWAKSTKGKLIRICEEFATGKVFAIESGLSSSDEFKVSLLLHAYYYKTVGFYFVFLDHDKMTRISGAPNNWTIQNFSITWS